MYAVMNRLPVNQEYAEAFETRFRERAKAVDGMPGFLRTLVLRPDTPDAPYVVLTLWESKADFEAWTQSESFQKGHSRSGTLPKEAFAGPSQLEMFETFVDSEEKE